MDAHSAAYFQIHHLRCTFQLALYGEKGGTKKGRQTLLLGERELNWLAGEARRLAEATEGDAKAAKEAAADWRKELKKSPAAMNGREQGQAQHAGYVEGRGPPVRSQTSSAMVANSPLTSAMSGWRGSDASVDSRIEIEEHERNECRASESDDCAEVSVSTGLIRPVPDGAINLRHVPEQKPRAKPAIDTSGSRHMQAGRP
jgi:hypothetical protein